MKALPKCWCTHARRLWAARADTWFYCVQSIGARQCRTFWISSLNSFRSWPTLRGLLCAAESRELLFSSGRTLRTFKARNGSGEVLQQQVQQKATNWMVSSRNLKACGPIEVLAQSCRLEAKLCSELQTCHVYLHGTGPGRQSKDFSECQQPSTCSYASQRQEKTPFIQEQLYLFAN